MTIPEAATYAGVSRQAVWLWCKMNKIGEKVGRDWFVDRAKLEQHMECLRLKIQLRF